MYVIAVLRNHSCADTYNTTFLDGAADALPLDIHTLAKTFTVCVMLYVVLEVIETIRLICNIKGWEIKFLSIIELIGLFAMLSVVAEIGLNSSWSSAGTIQVFPMYLLGYLAVFPIWTGIRLLMHKSMEEWEESGEQILKTQENDNRNGKEDYIFQGNIRSFITMCCGRILNITGEIFLFYLYRFCYRQHFCSLDLE